MRVFIITQEEPFFMPKVIEGIFHGLHKDDQLVGACVLKPFHRGKNIFTWIIERARVYTLWEFLLVDVAMSYVKIYSLLSSLLPFSKSFSVKKVFNKHNVLLLQTGDINNHSFIKQVKGLEVDVIVSLSATQIFSKQLIDAAKKDCINVHGTLLPQHRGVMGSWWTLACGDEQTGVTVHEMVERLDAGDILLQEKIRIEAGDTQFSLAANTKKLGSQMTLQVLDKLRGGTVKGRKMVVEEGSIHSFPSREEAWQFRKRGRKVLRLKDLKTILGGSL